MKHDKKVDKFLLDSEDFIESFQPEFTDYFVALCKKHNKFHADEVLVKVANLIYEDVFNIDIFLTTLEGDVFSEMREEGIMIGFLINRSMFYLLENYIQDANVKNLKFAEHMETFVLMISEYVSKFEKQICEKNSAEPLHVNFDTQDNILLGTNIIDTFKKIGERGEEVTFFNLYKGIPIRHNAIILDIHNEEVTFKTMQTKELGLQSGETAYILKDKNFDKYIKADVLYSNFTNDTFVLNNFTYLLNMPATQREFVRVHPDIMAEVSLSFEENLITKGKLFDLSVNGLGVISEQNNGIYAGAKVSLNFTLLASKNEKAQEIVVEGEILNIIEYSDSYRYCIKTFPEDEMQEKIDTYVSTREKDILDSLRNEKEV